MLRRTFTVAAIHRLITGVTLNDPAVARALDEVVRKRNLPCQPAAYWITADVARAQFISLAKQSQPAFETTTTATLPEGKSTESKAVQFFHVSASDCPTRLPVHVDANSGKPLPRAFQTLFESVAVQKRYSSCRWATVSQLRTSGRKVKPTAQPIPITTKGRDGKLLELSYYNEDDLVPESFLREQQKQSDTSVTGSSGSGGSDNNNTNDGSGVDPALNTPTTSLVLRSGLNKQLASKLLQDKLSAIKAQRGYKSCRWFTPSQMIDAMKRPRSGECIIEIISDDGNLWKAFNEDQLELGCMSKLDGTASGRFHALREFFPPRFATSEQERRAAKKGNFLDGAGRNIWQTDVLDVVKTAFEKRESSNSSSRQFLTLYEINTLGSELKPDAIKVEVTGGGGVLTSLYNKSDTRPVKKAKATAGDAA